MNTIICSTDFSSCADNAIQYANLLAIRAKAKLILLHSSFIPDGMPYAGLSVHAYDSFYKEERMYQDRLVGLCQELKEEEPNASVNYETKLTFRPVIDEIAYVAEKENADLIVMGTSGAHGLKEILLGSNTASVIEISKRPVLVVPDTASFTDIKRIVFAADLTREHHVNVSFTVELAKLFDAEILFLHVLKESNFMTSTTAKIEYAKHFSAIGYDKVSFHLQEDIEVERGIVDFSQDRRGDLIVMVNHERNFWRFIFNRSHTKQMAYHSPIPILAIHD